MQIAIAGGTGLVGQLIANSCLERGHATRCLVRPRSEAKAAGLLSRGGEVIWGDVGNAGAVRALCKGVDALITSVTSTSSQDPSDTIELVDRIGNLSLIQAAEAASVRRFVFLSFPAGNPEVPLNAAKRAVEAGLAESSLEWINLHIPLIMESWLTPLAGFDLASKSVRLIGSGEAQVPWISASDVARAVLAAVESPALARRTLVLRPSDQASLESIAQRFEAESGHALDRDYLALESIQAEFKTATEARRKSYLAICLALGFGYRLTGDEALPPPVTTLADYVRTTLARRA